MIASNEEELSLAERIAVVDHTIRTWKQQRFQSQLDYRVHESIMSTPPVLDGIVGEIRKAEGALAFLAEQRAKLISEQEARANGS